MKIKEGKMKQRFTDEIKKQIVELKERGNSLPKVAELLGLNRYSVANSYYRGCKKNKYLPKVQPKEQTKNHRFTTEEISNIGELKAEGKSLKEVAETLGLSIYSVRNYYGGKYKTEKPIFKFPKDHMHGTNGSHPQKWARIGPLLTKNANKFDTLVTCGYQNCTVMTEVMKEEGKKVLAIDLGKGNKEFYEFSQKNDGCGIICDLEDKNSTSYILTGIKAKEGKCAIFINLTGNFRLIKTAYELGYSPILAVVTPRSIHGKDHSAQEECKKLGFTIYQLPKNGDTNSNISIAYKE
jgi:lambda repressor-like predicted transcriptional regulator